MADRNLKYCLLILSTILLWTGCAKIGSPTGGARDVTPPVFLGGNPANGAANVKARKYTLYFDEHVQVKDASTNVTVSPPMKVAPQYLTAPKRLIIVFGEELIDSTTYTISFGEGLVDLNEGNPISDFELVFSTGDVVDSLSYTGRVLSAETLEPEAASGKDGALYFTLYPGRRDTIPAELPRYACRVDDMGYFRLNQIAPGEYTAFAVLDNNNNYVYDIPSTEKIAFLDSTLKIDAGYYKADSTKIEKRLRDSLFSMRKEEIAFDGIFSMFSAYGDQQRMSSERKDSANFLLKFDIPAPQAPSVRFLGDEAPDDWFVCQPSAKADSFYYFVTDTLLFKMREWQLEVGYMTTDSLLNWIPRTDTIRLMYDVKPKTAVTPGKQERRKRSDEPEKATASVKVNPYPVQTNWNSDFMMLDQVFLTFQDPLFSFEESSIRIIRDSLDSVPFKIRRDSLNLKKVMLDWDKEFDHNYTIEVDSAAFTSIYKSVNDTLQSFTGSLMKESGYATLSADISGANSQNIVIQLLSTNGEIRQHYSINSDTILLAKYLPSGDYLLRAVHDSNGNGVWDTGDFRKKLQPERIEFYQATVSLKKNFETQIEWELKRYGEKADLNETLKVTRDPSKLKVEESEEEVDARKSDLLRNVPVNNPRTR